MNIIDSLILGTVQGITEFLPISSTGHLIITSKLLGLATTEFLKSFEITIQLGTILSVVFLYSRTLLINREVIKRIFVAFLPTAIAGFLLYKFIKEFLFQNSHVVIWSLFLGGIFLVVFELLYKENKDSTDDLSKITFKNAFLIGVFQSIAVIPGVSRSAATIIGGLMLGLKRKTIVEFSFLLAVPTMLAATALDLLKSANTFRTEEFGILLVGFVSAFLVATLSIKFLLNFIKNNNFIIFGIYRIAAAILFIFLLR